MATNIDFINYICEQAADAGEIEYKKMFGEYGIYCNKKYVALAADNQLFVKVTEKGRAYLKEEVLAPPYTGATPIFLIESLDDKEYISELIRITYDELPEPKPKRSRSPKK